MLRKHKNNLMPKRGGFLEVLKISLPLILANSCHALNMFVDRLMLARHSQEAVAAAFTGGLTNFTISCIFIGTIVYTGTFVAQYEGAGQREKIGGAMWQGIWMALFGALILMSGFWWSKPLFESMRHDPVVTVQEIQYFKLLTGGLFIFLLSCVLPCFWSGRGKTDFVLAVSAIITLCNIPFNYVLIFGHCGFPNLGVAGAALGTVLSETVGVIIYCSFFFAPSARRHFGTLKYKLNMTLMGQMLRYGFPNGVNLALDLIAFNTFSLILGCYGVFVHEAASITFGINNIAFCPMIGIGTTASIMVGQAIGARNIPLAKKAVKSCLYLTLAYCAVMIVLFTIFQDFVLSPFVRPGDLAQLKTMSLSKIMLFFIAGYLFFDGLNMTFSNALRGAGDTTYTMYLMLVAGIFLFALPCLILFWIGCPWWTLWIVFDVEIVFLSVCFTRRYKRGKWTKMRVIGD